ncbi:MAG: hypothetical protein WCR54_05845 [Clostridia bacterium]
MKKKLILLVALILICSASLVACNSTPVPAAAWAGSEVLNYEVATTSGEIIGSMVCETKRKQSATFSNLIDDVNYENADNSFKMHLDTNKVEITTNILTKGYNTLAIKKVYVDKEDSENNYTVVAYHSGKYFYYTLNGEEQNRVKMSSGYTDSEFLYNYLRCYQLSSLPTDIKILDPLTKTIIEVGATNTGLTKVFEIAYPNGNISIQCNEVEIALNSSPVGKPIKVYYTPDQDEYNLSSFSMDVSKNFPVMIIENEITYRLTSVTIA